MHGSRTTYASFTGDSLEDFRRNCIEGKVVAIHDGPVSTEVTVATPAGERIVSSITTTSAKALGLKGAKAYAVIKASNVMLAVD